MSNVKDLAYEDYKNGMKYKDIAIKYGVAINTVKSWNTRFNWAKGANIKGVRTQTHSVRTKKECKKTDELAIKAVSKNRELSDKQKLFCIHWTRNKNGTLAAINAGYAPESAHVEATRLLRNTKVREYINEFIDEVRSNVMISTSEIIERYMKIAFADMTDYIEWGREWQPVMERPEAAMTTDTVTGQLIPPMQAVNKLWLKESSMIDGGIVCEIFQGKSGTRFKLEDRQKALDWLSKYFLMNPLDRHKIDYDNKILDIKSSATSKENDGQKAIQQWLQATKPSVNEIESIFSDEDVIEKDFEPKKPSAKTEYKDKYEDEYDDDDDDDY